MSVHTFPKGPPRASARAVEGRDAPKAPNYAELLAITNFSFLRGGSHAEEMVAQAKALGLGALAIADRNSLAGVVRAHVAAKKVGLRLLVGARLVLEDWPHLVCLPTDRAAYGRLSQLISRGRMRAEKGSCDLTMQDVAEFAEGQVFIIVPPSSWSPSSSLTGLDETVSTEASSAPDRPSASHQTILFQSQIAHIKAQTPTAKALYIAGAFTYRGDDRARLAALDALARAADLKMIATNDPIYHARHRRPLQDVLTCIREKTNIENAGLRLEANAERYLKPPSEMRRLFRGFESALAATQDIAGACSFSLDELVYEYPEEPVPEGRSPQEYLEHLTWEGARWRFPAGITNQVRGIIAKELRMINQLDYARYFLTVHDIVRFARGRNILCQGRGSAANSVVCYCLAITAVNPTEVNLLFERFISPERKEPPDIDVDFEHARREEVIQYIYARYGRARAGLTATVISYRARSAVREVGKAMGLSEDVVSALAGMVWGPSSMSVLREKYVRDAGLDPTDPVLATVLELADDLVGFPRHLSQHVGGFVLTRGPLTEVVPIGNAAMADRTFIEWDKDDIEALGLLKIDVLALGMLTCIQKALDLVGIHHSRPLTLATVPREDPTVYDMLCRADSLGVFQVESRAQMNMLPRLKPRTYYDLVIQVAIVRPGPIQGDMVHPYLRRRNGLEPEIYPAPDPAHGPEDELRSILGKTKGVPLFQEQAMRIAMDAAQFNGAEINELRRALATFRKRGIIHLLEEKMVQRMVARGYDPDFATRCFNQIKGFGEYGFPESHAASFAHLVYISSWLKCHYPAAFCCAILNSQPMGFYAPAQLVRDVREHGVEVRPVDVNASDWDCTLEPGEHPGQPAVRLGFRQVDGVREADILRLVERRREQPNERRREPQSDLGLEPQAGITRAAFTSIHDLWRETGVMRATLERLAAGDAMRSMGLDRRQALWDVKSLGSDVALPLFDWSDVREDGEDEVVRLPEMALSEHVVNDYQTLRLSLKAHPLSFVRERLDRIGAISSHQVAGLPDGAPVVVAGVVLVRQRPGSAKGVVFMTLEDETGVCNTVVWPQIMERYRKVLMTARLVLVRGRVQRHEDIVHVVSRTLEDKSDWLLAMSDWAEDMKIPIANADEVLRPNPGSARSPDAPRWPGHPRNERVVPKRVETVLPKSRDFH